MASLMKAAAPSLQARMPKVQSRKTVVVNAKVAAKTTKPKASNALMVCVDCGYLYDGKRGPFEQLPSSYACPVCGANKKRFKAYTGNKRSNDGKTMSARAEELREQLAARGESVGEDASTLLITAVTSGAFLAAVYYFTTMAR